MKVLFTILIVSICSFATAQTKVTLDYYSIETLDEIGATKEQQKKIAEIRKNTNTEIRAVKNNASLSEEQKKAEYKRIYGAGTVLYNEVLSPEQKSKLKALREKITKQNAESES